MGQCPSGSPEIERLMVMCWEFVLETHGIILEPREIE